MRKLQMQKKQTDMLGMGWKTVNLGNDELGWTLTMLRINFADTRRLLGSQN